jgi:hypothetical protein
VIRVIPYVLRAAVLYTTGVQLLYPAKVGAEPTYTHTNKDVFARSERCVFYDINRHYCSYCIASDQLDATSVGVTGTLIAAIS